MNTAASGDREWLTDWNTEKDIEHYNAINASLIFTTQIFRHDAFLSIIVLPHSAPDFLFTIWYIYIYFYKKYTHLSMRNKLKKKLINFFHWHWNILPMEIDKNENRFYIKKIYNMNICDTFYIFEFLGTGCTSFQHNIHIKLCPLQSKYLWTFKF